ncbi:MAG: prephenate dehydrogenase/arogenate dehydrogenase family protein, partial [Deltaproteobacteria bacterium]|nr:prephenate dehydrogenase/arogenate dehydrogenase family protein [Deltaproteobacteria bacterium]
MTMERIGIIGYGRFGKVLAGMLKDDFEVLVCSRRDLSAEVEAGVRAATLDETLACETLFYAVPISEFEHTLKSHLPFFEREKKPKVIIDVLSVKLYPKEVMQSCLPAHVHALLTHPMFGPDSVRSGGLEGQPIVVDRLTLSDQQYDFWKGVFVRKGLRVIEMSAEEHDRLAAYSQGLTHFIGRVLDELKVKPSPIDTLGAKKLLEIREQTCNDTWQLFTDLQTRNPFTLEMRVKLGNAVDRIYGKLLPNRIDSEKLVVGIQGGRGSFNEAAALYYLKRADVQKYRLHYLYTSAAVLKALYEGSVDRGQFAIHNSAGGIVDESIEAMTRYKFKIAEQFSIKISHALMIRPDASLDEIDTIMTHPQVLRQCKVTLAEKYARLRLTSGTGDLVDSAKVAEQLGAKELPKNIATMGSSRLA